MDGLEAARAEINAVDREMAELFCRRMRAVAAVAAYKRAHGLPVLDSAREKEVIARNAAFVEDAELRSFYVMFQNAAMAVSRQYQQHLLMGRRVAYSGVPGAFAEAAVKRIFGADCGVPCGDFSAAYAAVEAGECECAVLPLENSVAGSVGQVLDLLFEGNLHLTGVFDLPVKQHLLGVGGATLADIRRAVSHPQALSQCESYLSAHGIEAVPAVNTAVAAMEVAKGGDIHTAAVASAETATLYGLSILDHDIAESADNVTRFGVFSRVLPPVGAHSTFLLLFSVRHSAGALADALQVIARYGFNMRALHSRPLKDRAFGYYFYTEVEGDETSEAGKQMLKELSAYCERVRVAGHYAGEMRLAEESAT